MTIVRVVDFHLGGWNVQVGRCVCVREKERERVCPYAHVCVQMGPCVLKMMFSHSPPLRHQQQICWPNYSSQQGGPQGRFAQKSLPEVIKGEYQLTQHHKCPRRMPQLKRNVCYESEGHACEARDIL